MFNFGSPRLQSKRLQLIENDSSRHFLDGGDVEGPKSDCKVEVVDVEAEEPDDVVDVENCFRTKLTPQLVVDEEEHDVEHGEDVPPKHGRVGHLRIFFW